MSEATITPARKPGFEGQNTRELNGRRVSQVLHLTYANGGWITASIIALAMFFGDTDHQLTYAQRLLWSAAKGGLLLARQLPVRSHALAYVLTKNGAARLAAELAAGGRAPEIRPGTTWGSHKRGEGWHPPAQWIHNERGARFLQFAAHTLKPEGHWVAMNETQIRRFNANLGARGNYPDGLLLRHTTTGRKGIWVEVEQSRKTGAHRRTLMAHLANLAAGRVPPIRVGHDLTNVVVVARQAFMIFRDGDQATTFERAASRWLQRHPGERILYQVAVDDLDTLALRLGPVVDLGIMRNAPEGKVRSARLLPNTIS